ncbi:MAG TPA: cytochrome b/b6 domain-containing protein [Candidatus Polarisedimenticolia bacterium]|nr:cytochrome b/b6 domain-containing protein [Candidatus Polarisedimenticolia bacterium]
MARSRILAYPATVRVWDPLLRVTHWLLAASVVFALMSDESRSLHKLAGYVAAGLVVLRIVWGFLGPQHARFTDFVKSPGAVFAYLSDVVRFRPRRYLGHNPAGGAMIVLLFVLVLVTAFSGWLSETDRFFGVGWIEAVHAGGANLLIGLIVLHVGGVIFSSFMHGENLIRAMFTGHKPVETLGEIVNGEGEVTE